VKIFVHSSNPHRYRLSPIVSPPSTKDHRRSTTPSVQTSPLHHTVVKELFSNFAAHHRSTTVVSHPHLQRTQGKILICIFFLCLGLRFDPPFAIVVPLMSLLTLQVCDLDLASKKTKRQGLVMIWTAVVWAIWTTT
jgi:hypothetical protein